MLKQLAQGAVNSAWALGNAFSRQRPEAATQLSAPQASAGYTPSEFSLYNGDKFAGGFGTTQIFTKDYWALRQRSAQLFTENLYARGLIRRLITNEINTGLTPEAAPDEDILGLKDGALTDWAETVENRFGIWGKDKAVCDWARSRTFGELQREIRREALIEGDILVVLRQNPRTKLPSIQTISGSRVRTPLGGDDHAAKGHKITHGVEFDKNGRVVAYWVQQDDNTSKRLAAFGARTGRRVSWLVFGSDKRMDDVRGEPLLSLVLQSLKEIDRYRDSTQRKAVINSILAMFIKKGEDKPGTLPMTGGAVRGDAATVATAEGTTRQFNIEKYVPGLVIEELQHGEEPITKGGEGTDLNFGQFEEAIIQAVAWANEIPPEILRLAFSNNYSASQAAINEFKIYLNLRWSVEGENLCGPVYVEWLLSETLLGRVAAPSLIEAWRDPSQYDIFGAWVCTDWYGSIKPSTDMLKQVKASELLVGGGYSTRAREARITTGTKYSKNIKRLKRENEQLAESRRPLAEFEAEFAAEPESSIAALDSTELDDYINERGTGNG